MKHRHYSLVLASLCSLLLVPLSQAQEINLFNGRDLSGWAGLKEFWSVKDGAITGKTTSNKAANQNTCLVWQGGEVADFELSCKFKMEAGDGKGFCNSGVQFRSAVVEPGYYVMAGYQTDMALGPKPYTGILYEEKGRSILANVGEKAVIHDGPNNSQVVGSLGAATDLLSTVKQGSWSECRIVAVGNHIQQFIDGRQTIDAIDEGSAGAKSGLIGFQIHKGGPMTIQFKDIKLKRLAPAMPSISAPSAPAFSATVQTDANQPRIEVVKEQGPNATEWALTPLAEAIPGDIRQNLTYLREDLLDESKKSPKAAADAYTLASDYCDKILSALDQRDLARVNAGFTAAQADAGVRVDSQALSARRSSQMTWPQYAREKDQRNESLRQQTSGADVKKERIKVEWATRAVQMRSYLDGLYTKLRAAMR